MEIPEHPRTDGAPEDVGAGTGGCPVAGNRSPWLNTISRPSTPKPSIIGKIFALRADEVRMPGGDTARREVVEHYGAVAVLAIDDDNNIVLVYQYRHPLGRRLWELPAGLLDLGGEPPHVTRGTRTAGRGRPFRKRLAGAGRSRSTPGFSDESVRVYRATVLSDIGRPDAHDEEADLVVKWFPLTEAVRMVFSGEIVNSIAVAGILAAHAMPNTSMQCDPSMHRGPTGRHRSAQEGSLMTTLRRSSRPLLPTALDDQLQGYLDHLTIERGVAANTLSSYRRDLRRYAEHLTLRGIDDLGKVTETDVSDFLVALRRGDPDAGIVPLSAVSAARALIAVRGLHRFAAAEGLIELDVARAVKPPTPSRRLPKSLTLDEVLALLDGARAATARPTAR